MSTPPQQPPLNNHENPFSHLNNHNHHNNIQNDTVFYTIYPDNPTTTSPTNLHSKIVQTISPYTSNHIWQHQPFSLTISTTTNNLHGSLRYGDNLDDEWFTVFLLFHISRVISDVSIKVWDSDGEFLLIEAAFYIPKWITPDNSDNRVFVRGGEVRIIGEKEFPGSLSFEEAVRVLIEFPDVTRASDDVQLAIKRRVDEFPDKARRNVHCVRARVPISVAQVLRQEASYISLAVEGFYDRDIDSMKYAAKMDRFLPKGREEELCLISVKMSRAMYGQLIQQKFQAPKCYPMPPMPPKTDQRSYAEAELGMKIACGFEMIYQHKKKEGQEGKGSTWDAYIDSLEKSGYFNGLLTGSKEFKRLMENAEESYKKSVLHHEASEKLSAPVRNIDDILALPHSVDDFNGQEVPSSDDDSWLYGGEEELNSVLIERQREMEQYEEKKKRKHKGKDKANDGDSSIPVENDVDLGDMAKSMKAFMHKVSSYQGAEVPKDRDLNDVELDMDLFMKELEAIAGIPTHEDDDDAEEGSSSDMDFDESEDDSDMEEQQEEYSNMKQEDFMNAYSDALNDELKSSTLKKSFVRANDHSSTKNEGLQAGGEEEMDEDLSPVDVDVNLVKSLLDSFSSQQGLPGPASNLLGLMGKHLPLDDARQHKGKGRAKDM